MERLATGYTLVEGPVWDEARGLLFSDVLAGGVFAVTPDGQVWEVVPKRRGIGGMAPHADGGLIVGGRDIAWVGIDGEAPAPLLTSDVTPEAIGFNDLTTDAAGRIWAGTVAFRVFGGEPPQPGHLHVIDLDGSVRTVSDGIMLTNGMGFSPDGKRLYHSDARADVVRVYDIEGEAEVAGWRPFASFGDGATPDGLAVGEDGSVWVALAHGGCVRVFDADGSHREDIAVPLPMVTSVCFGGDDLRDLYIVTGSRGGPSENCGSVFKTRVDIPGLPVPPARVSHA